MFNLHRINNVAVCAPSIKQINATSGVAFKVGDALVLSSGKAVKATGTAVPTYICAEEKTAGSADVISAYLIEANQEYETELDDAGAVAVGTKYTIGTGAATITSTTTSGVAEVVATFGSAKGDKVIVKF